MKSTAEMLRSGYSLAWTRVEPGLYVCGEVEIRREATTHGIKRASNPMWSLREAPLVATYPYNWPDVAKRTAREVGGYAVFVHTAYGRAEWRVHTSGARRSGRFRTLAEAKARAERAARRG